MLDIFTAFGFESDDEMTDDRKIEALNEVYQDALGREGWPFLQATATLAFAGGALTPSNDPGDIGAVLMVFRADGQKLEPWRMDDFYDSYASNLTQDGSPLLYFFEGGDISFYPVPSAADAVTVKYQKIAPDLTALTASGSILLPPRYHRSVLVMGTLAKLAMMQDDTEMAQAYEAQAEKAIALMTEDLLREQYDRTEFIHVNDPDNWDYSA